MYGGLYYGQPTGQGPYAQPQGYFSPPQYGFPNYGPVPPQQPQLYSSNTSLYRFPNVTNSTPMPMGPGPGPAPPQGQGPGPIPMPMPSVGRFPGPIPPGANKGPPLSKNLPGPNIPLPTANAPPPAAAAPPTQNARNVGDTVDDDDDDDDSDDEEAKKKKEEEEKTKSKIPGALSKFKDNPYTKQALHGGASAVGQGLIAGPGGGVLGGLARNMFKGATKCCVIL